MDKVNGEIFAEAKPGRKCAPLYAKIEKDFVTVYAKAENEGVFSVSTICASREVFPINLGMIKNGARVQISEILDSADSLTAL